MVAGSATGLRRAIGKTLQQMNNGLAYLFPTTLIGLDLAAAIVYASMFDWRRSIYWIAAAVLTACVTF